MKYQFKANSLPLAIVVSTVMLLMVLGVLLLWEIDFLHFSKQNFVRQQQADIKSTLALYTNYPSIIEEYQDSVFVQLYDSIESSQMLVERQQWGLYELVSVSSANRKAHQTCIMGFDSAYSNDINFYYPENKSTLTLTGKTDLEGRVAMPTKGIIYGQIKSVFFRGKKIENSKITTSKELPNPDSNIKKYIDNLFSFQDTEDFVISDSSIHVDFYNNEIKYLSATNSETEFYSLNGKIVLAGDEITISSDSKLKDIIIVANKININKNFEGSLQIFSRDTVIIGENVKMNYPSGIFCEKYIKIGDNAQINGYVIINNSVDKIDTRKANYIQSRLAKVRGLLYIRGAAQIQGIVSGCAYVARAVFYSPQGYYNDMIYDVTILENRETAYPLWFKSSQKRKIIKWTK
ncbi:MAG: hypothetical protein LBP63_03105 [Prevotellaceae bacterium]|jgi:hypothetical protein|nr:hypothetical protein [Prevotellaceae bacterium]